MKIYGNYKICAGFFKLKKDYFHKRFSLPH